MMWNKNKRQQECVNEVLSVINQEVDIYPLQALKSALKPCNAITPLQETVIAFDANVFLRLSNAARSEDVIDFLRTSFKGSLILPSQTVQEFWNNQYNVVDTIADKIKKQLTGLKDNLTKIDEGYGEYSKRFEKLLDEFQENYGYVIDEHTLQKTSLFIDLLSEKALVPTFPRNGLTDIAEFRKRAKTPPGFKDKLDGDFYVWVDLLYGLSLLKLKRRPVKHVILVSQDSKADWVQNKIPHPVLSAEIKAITKGTFEICDISSLSKKLLD